MRTIVHTCDVCKQCKSESDLSKIRVDILGITIGCDEYRKGIEYDVCKECLKKRGFIVEPIPGMHDEEIRSRNTKTLRGKLMEMLEN